MPMRRRRIFGKGRDRSGASVDMAPLIDMVFLLLIFFVVTTSFVNNSGVVLERPRSERAQALSQSPFAIAITKRGEVFASGRRIEPNDVAGLREMLGDGRSVLIEPDRETGAGTLLEVYDTCLAAGATNIDIAAVRP